MKIMNIIDNEKLKEMLNKIGESDLRYKMAEVQNDLLKIQNEALIKQNLMMKGVLEEHNII